MKKLLSSLIFVLSAVLSIAQDRQVYLDKNDKPTAKRRNASSYIIVKKISDTAWLVNQFSLQDSIMQTGTFKDNMLTIPNGKFAYYRKLGASKLYTPFVLASEMDKNNHLLDSGEFRNGLKNGFWTRYYLDGHPEFVSHYLNNLLDGPYKSYRAGFNSLLTEGNYIGGQRDGEWHLYNPAGEIMQTTIFRYDRIEETHKFITSYKPSQPSEEFYSFIEDNIKKLADNRKAVIVVDCNITANGALKDPKLESHGIGNNFDNKLIELLNSAPAWVSATKGTTAQPMEDFATIIIKININPGEIVIQKQGIDQITGTDH